MVTVHSTSEFRAVVHGQNHGGGNDLLPGQMESREALKAKKVGASVIGRKYDLNELTALKKKLQQETNKEPFSKGKEAKDGSNFTIQMRASMFENVKGRFIEDLKKDKKITKIENALATTANASVNVGNGKTAVVAGNGSKIAVVEYSMDITFKHDEHEHTVKMTAYSTTSNIMIQPKGEKPKIYDYLGNRATPKYFAEVFFLPWCEKDVLRNPVDSQKFAESIKEEIKKLEAHKTAGVKRTAKDKTKEDNNTLKNKSEVKCVSRNCRYGTVNIDNKKAVGNCDKCGKYEHFVCVSIDADEKEEIISGKAKFFCSGCFARSPTEIAAKSFKAVEAGKGQVSPNKDIPALENKATENLLKDATSENSVEEVELDEAAENVENIVTKALVHSPSECSQIVCNKCEFIADSDDTLNAHVSTVHKKDLSKNTNETPQIVDLGVDSDDSDEDDEEDDVFEDPEEYSYQCHVCEYTIRDMHNMQEHIFEHIEKDEDDLYHCDECDFTFHEKMPLRTHYMSAHFENEGKDEENGDESKESESISKNQINESKPGDDNESEKLKDELKVLRRNFKRLELMYNEALEDASKVKFEYEARLIEVNDKFSSTKAENEELKEKVDILFKLGKGYLAQGKTKDFKKFNQSQEDPDKIEVLQEESIDLTEEDNIESFVKNRFRRYKRVDPTTQSVPKMPTNESFKQKKMAKETASNHATQNEVKNNKEKRSDLAREPLKDKVPYCHYFVNYGKCDFEKRTGRTCRFEHRNAPPCRFGSGCTRSKCQFSHPKTQPRTSFLDQRRNTPSPWRNPWQAPQFHQISPWLSNPWQMTYPDPSQWPQLPSQRVAQS